MSEGVGMKADWTPFKRNGKLRVVFYTDPWWKRMWSRLRGEPLWYQTGWLSDDAEGEAMTQQYLPENGGPVDMSQVTLGPRYTSEDMYRDMGIERPQLPDVPWVDSIASVTIEVGED